MPYRVIGPRAVALLDGKRVVRARGALLPDGADAEQVKHLIRIGLVEEVKPAAKPAERKPAVEKQEESKQSARKPAAK